MSTPADELLALAVSPASLERRGNYTEPRTWGVYDVSFHNAPSATRRFRFGNHPVRQRELEAEFSKAYVIATFTDRGLARSLADLLNGEG